MMEFEAWRETVKDIVRQIADAEFQRLAWFGLASDEISSPDEMYNQLFGDAQIEQFLATYKHKLSPEQLKAGENLVGTMNAYADQTPKHLDPTVVIDDPAWQEIRAAAAAFVASIIRKRTGE